MGCGWLGLPVAAHFVNAGHQVKGTTTSLEKLERLTKNGIQPFHLQLSENGIEGDIVGFLDALEILFVNVPPRLRKNPNANYSKKMRHLCRAIEKSKVKNIIFVSSTSVYGEQEGVITEETLPKPITESARQLLESERLFTNLHHKTTILRFGGLIGPDRHPVYHLSKKKELRNGDELINLIHLEDCIHMIETIIENNYWNEIFNGVYPFHPSKREYYQQEAKIRNIPSPEYSETNVNVLLKFIKSKNFFSKNHSFFTSISS